MKHLIYGIHAVQALIETHPELIKAVYCQESRQDQRLQKLLNMADVQGIKLLLSTRPELDQLAESLQHQGIVAECHNLPSYGEGDLAPLLAGDHPKLLLVLDGVQDPHNLGACLRSANALGASLVIAPKDNSVGMTPVVRKVSCGASEATPFVQVTNLARVLRSLKEQGFWLVGTSAEATLNLGDADLKGNIVLVMGGEGNGLRRLTEELCDFLVKIPMQGTVSSLNVSVATAIALYEAQRQRS